MAKMVIFAGGTASRDVVKARSRVVLAGPPVSPPETTSVFCDRVSLRWGAPISSGGFAVRGYRVQAQTGGDGEFKDVITDTQDANPECVVTRLTATTWYEFRVAALNVHGTGAWSEASEPVLTPAAGSNGSGKPGQRRQRRSRQTGGPKAAAARAKLEEARMQMMTYAEQLSLSERTVQQWEDDWRVQHGGAPSSKFDRERSELLRDEAEIQLELRHVHAAARVAVCAAEVELARAEAAVAATMVAHWGQDFVALAGRPPLAEEREADERHRLLVEELATSKVRVWIRVRVRVSRTLTLTLTPRLTSLWPRSAAQCSPVYSW